MMLEGRPGSKLTDLALGRGSTFSFLGLVADVIYCFSRAVGPILKLTLEENKVRGGYAAKSRTGQGLWRQETLLAHRITFPDGALLWMR